MRSVNGSEIDRNNNPAFGRRRKRPRQRISSRIIIGSRDAANAAAINARKISLGESSTHLSASRHKLAKKIGMTKMSCAIKLLSSKTG